MRDGTCLTGPFGDAVERQLKVEVGRLQHPASVKHASGSHLHPCCQQCCSAFSSIHIGRCCWSLRLVQCLHRWSTQCARPALLTLASSSGFLRGLAPMAPLWKPSRMPVLSVKCCWLGDEVAAELISTELPYLGWYICQSMCAASLPMPRVSYSPG